MYENLETHYDDATWVGRRFAGILPISPQQKQYCLESEDALGRLEFLRPLLRSIRQALPQLRATVEATDKTLECYD